MSWFKKLFTDSIHAVEQPMPKKMEAPKPPPTFLEFPLVGGRMVVVRIADIACITEVTLSTTLITMRDGAAMYGDVSFSTAREAARNSIGIIETPSKKLDEVRYGKA